MNVDDRIRETLQAQVRAEEARLANGMVGLRSASRRRTNLPMLLATAALAAIVGVAGVLFWANRSTGSAGDVVVAVNPTTTMAAPPPSTDAPATTETPVVTETPAATTIPPTSEAPATTGVASPPARPATAVGRIDDDQELSRVVEVDVATGEVVRELATIDLVASGVSRIIATTDRDRLYFTQGWEDSWLSCETSVSSLRFVDASGGPSEPVTIGNGVAPQLSPDGTRLAYLASSRCVPDPENPEMWVLTPIDTVVVRDLATGEEIRWTDPELSAVDEAELTLDRLFETDLDIVAWLGDDELMVPGHRFRASDLDRIGAAPELVDAEAFGTVVGLDAATGAVLVEEYTFGDSGEENEAVLVAVDPDSGERSVAGITVSGPQVVSGVFAVDASGTALLVRGPDGLGLPDGSNVALEVDLLAIDW